MLVFSELSLAEDGAALSFHLLDPALSVGFTTAVPTSAWRTMFALRVVGNVALAMLLWITWD